MKARRIYKVDEALASAPLRQMAENQARSEDDDEWLACSDLDREEWVNDIIRGWVRGWNEERRRCQ